MRRIVAGLLLLVVAQPAWSQTTQTVPITGSAKITVPAPIPGIQGPRGPAGPIGPAGPPGSGSGGGSAFVKPTTQAAMQAALQAGFDNCYIIQLDPTTVVTAASTIAVTTKDCGAQPRGFNANGATINSAINDGTDVLRITAAGPSRGLVMNALHIYGGGYEGKVSGNCMSVIAPKGFAIYKATLRDLAFDYCGKAGLAITGDFFESLIANLNSENNRGDGFWIDHGDDGGIISNVMVQAPNLSRNLGYGFHAVRANSIDIVMGSFINNALGGLIGEHGIRTVDAINCENTGLACVSIPTSDYMTRLSGVNASTDGATAATGGVPLRYTFFYHGNEANLLQSQNYVTFYGSGVDNTVMRAP